MSVWAVIPAAGSSLRMGQGAGSKVLDDIVPGRSALGEVLLSFASSGQISGFVIASRPCDRTRIKEIVNNSGISQSVNYVDGGASRQESVQNALAALPAEAALVAVHDAARAFCSPEAISRVITKAKESGAALLAVPSKSTLKQVDQEGRIHSTINRDSIWEAQTPQVFKRELLEQAYEKAAEQGFVGTDESQLVERLNVCVSAVRGEEVNIKLTTPDDRSFGAWLLSNQATRGNS